MDCWFDPTDPIDELDPDSIRCTRLLGVSISTTGFRFLGVTVPMSRSFCCADDLIEDMGMGIDSGALSPPDLRANGSGDESGAESLEGGVIGRLIGGKIEVEPEAFEIEGKIE